VSTEEPITIHRHYHAARPLTVTRKNCLDVLGVEPSDLSATLRRLAVTNKGTNKNPIALLSDVEAAFREQAKRVDVGSPDARSFLRANGILGH
jgi:hypothetical protein